MQAQRRIRDGTLLGNGNERAQALQIHVVIYVGSA